VTTTPWQPRTLTFAAGSTQTVTGICTLQGAAGNLLLLRSSAAGTQWLVNPQGARAISYVDVQDSNNTNALAINPPNSIDSGNNINWFSPPVPPAPTPGGGGKTSSDLDTALDPLYRNYEPPVIPTWQVFGGAIAYADEIINTEGMAKPPEWERYSRKHYGRGKYKTTVTAIAGEFDVFDYTNTGIERDTITIVKAGQRTEKVREVL
jgi:hypothetical protein